MPNFFGTKARGSQLWLDSWLRSQRRFGSVIKDTVPDLVPENDSANEKTSSRNKQNLEKYGQGVRWKETGHKEAIGPWVTYFFCLIPGNFLEDFRLVNFSCATLIAIDRIVLGIILIVVTIVIAVSLKKSRVHL